MPLAFLDYQKNRLYRTSIILSERLFFVPLTRCIDVYMEVSFIQLWGCGFGGHFGPGTYLALNRKDIEADGQNAEILNATTERNITAI